MESLYADTQHIFFIRKRKIEQIQSKTKKLKFLSLPMYKQHAYIQNIKKQLKTINHFFIFFARVGACGLLKYNSLRSEISSRR
jgi:hypothetical protein